MQVRFSKFDGTPHWSNDSTLLGHDRFGPWIGGPPGTVFSRPGLRLECPTWWICLLSPRGFAFTRYAPDPTGVAELYIDLTTVPVWSPAEPFDRSDGAPSAVRMTAVDLDLDVIRHFGETQPWLDDEDEFAEHQVSMGYPADLVGRTERTAAELMAAVATGAEPFDAVSLGWMTRCRELLGE